MIEQIQTTDEKAIEHTWYTSQEKAVHDGAKLNMLRNKINELVAFLNEKYPEG